MNISYPLREFTYTIYNDTKPFLKGAYGMRQINIDPILEKIEAALRQHEISPGCYTRWTRQPEQSPHPLGPNPYACADAAAILHILNRFPANPAVRAAFVDTLQGFQDQESGLFMASTHHVVHTTACCVNALHLLGAKAKYPFVELNEYLNVQAVFDMLEERDWLRQGLGAHPGAGLYTVLAFGSEAGAEWEETYFSWLDSQCDVTSGFWKKEPVDDTFTVWQQLRDTANFLFNYEYARRPFPCPMALIDSCLNMYLTDQMPENFGKGIRHFELDWVYCLNRASRQTSYRFEEIKAALNRFAQDYTAFLCGIDWTRQAAADDLHCLCGTLHCLTELQQALPGVLKSSRPLLNTLDRHPF